MKLRRALTIAFGLLLLASSLPAQQRPKPKEDKSELSELQRQDILRAFQSEFCFMHRLLPLGKEGLRIEAGTVTPSDREVRAMVAQVGAAARPGERAHITMVRFEKNGIMFEINGGPTKKKKWYERLSVGAGGSASVTPTGQPANDDLYINSQGSNVFLAFPGRIPSLTPDQVKELLAPVLDFKSQTMAAAFLHSLSPVLTAAVKEHRALVGMDKETVTYALGRPPRRIRETDDQGPYEEWIYGAPPDDTQFIRFHGERVTRIETMRADGDKLVRTEDEVGDVSGMVAQTQKPEEPPKPEEQTTRPAPSLRRPGEDLPEVDPQGRNKSAPLGAPPPENSPPIPNGGDNTGPPGDGGNTPPN